MSVAVIVNPISGTGGRADVARARATLAASLLEAHRVAGSVHLTEGVGHARELANTALERGASTVIAWGGDGTMNEVASALAFRDAVLGLIPSGSGNGLARELRIPFDPKAALAVALGAAERRIDCGDIDGQLFFNVAGMGLEARVADRFSADSLLRRGFRRYVEVTLRELFQPMSEQHTVTADGVEFRQRTLLLTVANSRQYGNGAMIAPRAKLDDGKLDIVMVSARSPWVALFQAPLLFLGAASVVPGVTMVTAATIEIVSEHPVLYHVDGETHVGGARVRAQVHPRALRVKVPE